VRRRHHVGEPDDASLRLRNDLLRERDDVAVLEVDLCRYELRQVVAFLNLRQAGDGDDAQLSTQGRPVRRIPACAL